MIRLQDFRVLFTEPIIQEVLLWVSPNYDVSWRLESPQKFTRYNVVTSNKDYCPIKIYLPFFTNVAFEVFRKVCTFIDLAD